MDRPTFSYAVDKVAIQFHEVADLGECRVIRIVIGNGDLDLVGIFELLDEFRAGIVTPVEDIQFAVRQGTAGGSEHARAEDGAHQFPLHKFSSLLLT